ncbi:hypothetical protein KJ925_03615 [Patescibacteria group bacterium]|nr:hypothetical protein [Patescibacteria group bacterium]
MDITTRLKILGLILAVVIATVALAYAIREQNLRIIAERETQRLPETSIVVMPTEPEPAEPTPSVTDLADPTGSIHVMNMVPGQLFLNGSVVEGMAVAFESQFSWKLADADGRTIVSGYTMAKQPDAGIPGPFSFLVFFDKVPATASGTLILYEASAKDGTPIHVLRIPVAFLQETMTVNVYFGNTVKNPNAMDCSLVYPVERVVPKGGDPVHVLLAGPTAAERRDGYYTSIPDGVVLQGYGDLWGNMTYDFNQELQQNVGGSCRVGAIRSQIEHTALQGDVTGATEVGVPLGISIDGRSEDILQP